MSRDMERDRRGAGHLGFLYKLGIFYRTLLPKSPLGKGDSGVQLGMRVFFYPSISKERKFCRLAGMESSMSLMPQPAPIFAHG